MAPDNSRRGPSRRGALAWLAGAAAVLSGRPALAAVSPEARLARLAGRSPRAARAIGNAYLGALTGPRPTPAALVEAVASRIDLAPDAVAGLGHDALAGRIEAAIRQDFERYDTAVVDGWVLSSTEARLCALVALR